MGDEISEAVLGFVRLHQAWAPAIVLLLAFGESLAFVSLLVPATAILLAVGGLIAAADMAFWPIWCAAALGAALGDWVSYWLGRRYGHAIAGAWPLSRDPALLARGETFFRKWGTFGVFAGRFFGPLRSITPVAAGICGMRPLPFQLANIASALVWATGVLTPGFAVGAWLL